MGCLFLKCDTFTDIQNFILWPVLISLWTDLHQKTKRNWILCWGCPKDSVSGSDWASVESCHAVPQGQIYWRGTTSVENTMHQRHTPRNLFVFSKLQNREHKVFMVLAWPWMNAPWLIPSALCLQEAGTQSKTQNEEQTIVMQCWLSLKPNTRKHGLHQGISWHFRACCSVNAMT